MTKIFYIVIFLFSFLTSPGQHTIQGLVYDADTDTPLPGANVFIANTTKGTSTDVDGAFRITGLQHVPYDLVISFVGYKTQVTRIVAGEPVRYKVLLKQKIQQLNEIIVRGKKISRVKRATWLRIFTENFIGKSDNAGLCKFENPDILRLDKEGNVLTASSDTALVLLNSGLGYRIRILLETYKFNTAVGSLHYEGHMVYEPLTPRSERQKIRWAKNRIKAYYGSQMHFLRSLYNHKANEAGYYFSLESTDSVMRPRSKLFNNRRIKIAGITDYNKIIDAVATAKGRQVLKAPGQLEVDYIHEGESVTFQRTMRMRIQKAIQVSYIKLNSPAEILPDGRTYPVSATQVGGYWSWELMSETLPQDYQPDDDLKTLEGK